MIDLIYFWTWGAPLPACHLALKSFNIEKQCLNIIFNPIDISAIVYITIELPYDVKKRLENSETKYVF